MKSGLKILMLLLTVTAIACNNVSTDAQEETKEQVTIENDSINLNHFNHLYKEIVIDGDSMAIVHIYSEAPDYTYTIEPREGYTCVDDVSRAVVMLSEYYKISPDKKATLRQIKMMIKFILHMQNENGYFNNFIWNDLTINTTYQTTIAELNWWSLRALWSMETALPLLSADTSLSDRVMSASLKLVTNLKADLSNGEMKEVTYNTITCPSWIPQSCAADQAAILMIGLIPYHERTGDAEVKDLIDSMAKGIMLMQKGDATHYPFGAFLSWQNLWHAWGNNQAYAMLLAGRQFNNQEYIDSGLKEVDHFYPYLLKNGFVSDFSIEKKGEDYIETNRNEFNQIAYGIRPMVWAAQEAYRVTKNKKYLELSGELKSWFFGNNVAKVNMYDANTGRGYDGIISSTAMNKNAGAESTIESLLTMLRTQ